MTISVSNSELRTFQSCQRQWYLAYYRRLARRPGDVKPTGAAQLGTRVHVALEMRYGYGLPAREVLTELYNQAVLEHPLSEQDLDDELDLGLAMLDGYEQWVEETGIDEGLEVVAVEQDIVVPSAVDGVDFRAKLDQRVFRRQDGARLFLDHKTVGSFEHATTILNLDPQMRFYAMLEMWLYMNRDGQHGAMRVDGGLFNMLKRSKRTARASPPFYRREEVRYNLETLRNTWLKANRVAGQLAEARWMLDKGMSHQQVTPPNPTRDCTWRCPFVNVCGLMDDGSRWEDALVAGYVEHDPYDYYQPVDVQDMRRRLGSDGDGDGERDRTEETSGERDPDVRDDAGRD